MVSVGKAMPDLPGFPHRMWSDGIVFVGFPD